MENAASSTANGANAFVAILDREIPSTPIGKQVALLDDSGNAISLLRELLIDACYGSEAGSLWARLERQGYSRERLRQLARMFATASKESASIIDNALLSPLRDLLCAQ